MPRGSGTRRNNDQSERYCGEGHDTEVVGRLVSSGKCCECVRIEQGIALDKLSERRSEKDLELVRYIFPIHPTQEGRANQIARKILEQVSKLEHCMPWEKPKIEKLIETLRDLM